MTATKSQSSRGRVPHLTVAERVERGKASRARTPRSAHAAFEPPGDRADPVALLEEQSVTRVPELVPIRYGRMLVSPFTFYRGAAKIMAADLATTPDSGLRVQCCGDAHMSNFGVFASPERKLVFDINDFDETLPGPWEWDVKRLAASVLIAAQENGFAQAGQERVRHLAGVLAQVGGQLGDLAGEGVRLGRPVECLLESRRGDQLHGPRDLADVADRLAALHECAEVGHASPVLSSEF